jgi:hypothetical protein
VEKRIKRDLSSDAIIYTVSDSTLLRSIGQYRAQGKDKAGKVIQLAQQAASRTVNMKAPPEGAALLF